jgi:nitroimidazol reductase NimA-like FMN-containing flavoprotein (pyridoxamine 5'-phosphate oxidase superfamily)
MSITIARFIDVAEGVKPGQFSVGEHDQVVSLSDLDPIYRQLMDEPVTAVLAVVGNGGRPNLTPVWFDYEGNKVLLNLAAHRKKVEWVRKHPQLTYLLMNPKNPYHWMSLKVTVVNEIHEDDPVNGKRAAEQLDKIWMKYTQKDPPYGLRDPSIDERRILFECRVDRIATFGKP